MSRPYLVLLALVLISVILQMIAPTVEGFHPIYRRNYRELRKNVNDQVKSTQSQVKRFLRQKFSVMS
jgi:hypothetical protein